MNGHSPHANTSSFPSSSSLAPEGRPSHHSLSSMTLKGKRMHEHVRESPTPKLTRHPKQGRVSSPAGSCAPQAPHQTLKREEGRSARRGESPAPAKRWGCMSRGGGPARHPAWPSGGAGGRARTAGLQPEGGLSCKPLTLRRSIKSTRSVRLTRKS